MVIIVVDIDYVDGDGNVKIVDFGFFVSYSLKVFCFYVNIVLIDV